MRRRWINELGIAPPLRYERVHRDERLHWRDGVELTVRVR